MPVSGRPLPDLPGVRHSIVTARGVRFHVAQAGDGEPVLMLHGFPQHWYAWHRVIPLLSKEYRLICPDLRGFGWSQATRRGYDSGTRAQDVLAIMDAMGLDRVRLVGHDWGGWAGFLLCARAPERVSHHLALNIVHPWPLHRNLLPQAWRFWYTAILESPGLGRWALRHRPSFTRFLMSRAVGDHPWDAGDLDEYAAASREPGPARAGEALHRQFVLHDITALVTGRYHRMRLTVPTLLLAGERDPVISPRMLPGGERFASDLRIRVVPGRGHFLAEEDPALVAGAARELFGAR